MEEPVDWYSELKTFGKFFMEIYLLLIIIQYVSDKVDNKNINFYKESKMAFIIAIILYIARYISVETQQNISQGFHYYVSGVFLASYNLV